jgi:hypothetical protein
MAKFEYQLIGVITNSTSLNDLAKGLTERGEHGWEIVSVGWPTLSFVLLKRQTK